MESFSVTRRRMGEIEPAVSRLLSGPEELKSGVLSRQVPGDPYSNMIDVHSS